MTLLLLICGSVLCICNGSKLLHHDQYLLTDNQTQRNALIDLAESTQFKNWYSNDNWLSTETYCNWYGISCDLHNNVISLNLRENNLNGSLPESIGSLSYLEIINMSSSSHSSGGGACDYSIGIQNTIFNNSIFPQSLTNLLELTYIDLGCSCIGGTLPKYIDKLQKLKEFRVRGCLINGTIPISFTNLVNLEVLKWGRNPIEGTLPYFDKKMKLIKWGSNFMALNGTLPDHWFNFPFIEHVVFDGNGFEGSIPKSMSMLNNITELALNMNNLNGTISTDFCNIWNAKMNSKGDSVHCHIGSDTNETANNYGGSYPWLLPITGNKYKCPLPSCCVNNGICNSTNYTYISSCTYT